MVIVADGFALNDYSRSARFTAKTCLPFHLPLYCCFKEHIRHSIMGLGDIFVATTLAPLVVVLASVSLQLLTLGLEQVKKCE